MKPKSLKVSLINSLLPVIFALGVGAILILLMNENPLAAYSIMFGRSLFTLRGLTLTLHTAAPLLLTGLAIAITFRANLFNMGVEGQLVFGGFVAGLVGAYVEINSTFLHILVATVAGIIAGMLFALVPAVLRAFFHVDELVVTLTLNYAMAILLEYLSSGPFRDPGAGYISTPVVKETAMFSRIGNTRLTIFFFISLLIFLTFWFLIKRTTFGYKIESIGKNPQFAEATGLRVRRQIMILMLLSGAISGLAGAGHMMSQEFMYTLSFSGTTGIGWDGMLISLLGGHTPGGILVAAIFYSALKVGADSINMYTGIPTEIVAVIQGLLILFLSVRFIRERRKVKKENQQTGGEAIGAVSKNTL